MSLIAHNSPAYYLPPEGWHQAVCFRVVDLGLQPGTATIKEKPQCHISFELPFCRHVFDEHVGEQSAVVGDFYHMSTHGDSHLRQLLEKWRGRPFTPDEIRAFDISQIAGAKAWVRVAHRPNGKTAFPAEARAMPQAERIKMNGELRVQVFSLDDPDFSIFGDLPTFLQDAIRRSKEWAALPGEQAAAEGPSRDINETDDVPF